MHAGVKGYPAVMLLCSLLLMVFLLLQHQLPFSNSRGPFSNPKVRTAFALDEDSRETGALKYRTAGFSTAHHIVPAFDYVIHPSLQPIRYRLSRLPHGLDSLLTYHLLYTQISTSAL